MKGIFVSVELLERAATSIEQRMCIQCEGVPCCMPESLNTLSDIRTILSAPSPAGVDGDFGWLLNLDLPEAQCNCQWNPDSHDKTGIRKRLLVRPFP